MSKILKNNTASPVLIPDVGQTVPASGQLVISPTLYSLYAASSNTVTFIGNATLTVNDGSSDLGISSGVDLIKGLFPRLEYHTQDITNTTMGLAGIESTVVVAATTKKITIRARQATHTLKIANVVGGTATSYITIRQGNAYHLYPFRPDSPGPTFYIASTKDATVLEIEEWS